MSTKAAGSAGRTVTKVGVTVVAAVSVTTQGAGPRQSPPAGAVSTGPIPAPLRSSVRAKLCTAKVAVTVVAAVTVTTQESVPVQAPPLQPVNAEPRAGVAVSVTVVL